jgi:lipase chaperone LimK
MTSATSPAAPGAGDVHLAQSREQALKRLQALLEDDPAEQQETFAYLQRAIDEDRPALRKRFAAS